MTTQKEQKGNQQTVNKQQDNQALQSQSGNQRSQSALAQRNQGWPSLMTASPFAFMRRFSEEMDRLFEDFGFGSLTPGFGRDLMSGFSDVNRSVWSPQVEIFEREGQLVVRADLPGMTKDDVNVEVTDDAIAISGERKSEHEEKGEGFYRSERSYGSFYRSIPLPEGINADDANATFKDGVLEITMQAPQRQMRGRRLEIKERGNTKEQARAQSTGR
ncbi:MAG TPA: Hsp20/alpha crystallin family protein [Pyrinomonadaceae bacterium]|nr:Hsp20/alpha crystallin family protein [Pyrinomonadaceae bacterium]